MTTLNGEITRSKLLGLVLTSLCILLLELTLTRIFSVKMGYHFAFVAISVALLGIGAGGLAVFLFEKAFAGGSLERQLPLCSSLMAVSIVVALVVMLSIPFVPKLSLAGFALSGIFYGAATVPFFFGGMCISLLLWRHADHVSSLYFSDLLGASLGCLVTLVALNLFTGPQVVLLASVMAACASVCFGLRSGKPLISWVSGATLVLAFLLFLFAQSGLLAERLRVKYALYETPANEPEILFEKWNSFSRVAVSSVGGLPVFGWGLSAAFDGYQPEQLAMFIDGGAGTQMINFDGDFEKVEFLKYDLSSLVYWLKKDAKSLIIGPGAGRDVLAALSFGHKPVTGVEINPSIVNAIRNDFRDFTGDIYRHPDVTIHVDEGRSFLSRSKEKYDIIQASFIDTWAATSSGAYILTENNLYTIEAFEEYLQHLEDDGMLTFTRWYYKDVPAEALRLMALAIEALERGGCVNTRPNLLLAAKGYWMNEGPNGVATLVVKKSPFTQTELQEAEEVCEKMGFQIVCSPRYVTNLVFARLFSKEEREKLCHEYPLNIVPSDDDKPFFFHLAYLGKEVPQRVQKGHLRYGLKATTVLVNLLVGMAVLAFLFLIAPLLIFRFVKPRELVRHWKSLLYFVLIGMGFISIELPLIQRFTLFLGHPIYALAVVLSSVLLFSGIGSFFTRRASAAGAPVFLRKALVSLVLLFIVYQISLSPFIHALIWLPTYTKVPITILLIAPAGLLMGMPFPLGIKLISEGDRFLIPWCWGLNGAFSVLASVVSLAVAITFGFTAAMGVGIAAYVLVLVLAMALP